MYNAFDILSAYAHGKMSESQAESELDKIEIRGDFQEDQYCGFDYRHQEWLLISWNILRQQRIAA